MSRPVFRSKKKLRRKNHLPLICLVLILVFVVVAGGVYLALSKRNAPSEDTPDDSSTPVVDTEQTEEETPTIEPVRELPADFITRNTNAPRIVLYDISAETLLYSKNADDQCAPASLTKLMTALVALEYADPDTLITAGDELYLLDPESSRAGIHIGHQMTLLQALQGLLLPSGNDTAYTIAANVGHMMDNSKNGKAAIDLFCEKMTEKAKDLGCTNTTFRNPDGIDTDEHLTTANDMLKIALAALDNPTIADITATKEVNTIFASGQSKSWQTSNKLMHTDSPYYYKGTTGMKTGTTDAAGSCLVSCATRDGRTVLCVLMGADTDYIRYNETIELLNLGFF